VFGVLREPSGGVSCLVRLKIAVSLGGIFLNIIIYTRGKDNQINIFKLIERRSAEGEEIG
jgi:hypothetical protein